MGRSNACLIALRQCHRIHGAEVREVHQTPAEQAQRVRLAKRRPVDHGAIDKRGDLNRETEFRERCVVTYIERRSVRLDWITINGVRRTEYRYRCLHIQQKSANLAHSFSFINYHYIQKQNYSSLWLT